MKTVKRTVRKASPKGSAFPHPKLQAIADYALTATEIVMERVIANHVEPGKYPLPQDPQSPERILQRLFEKGSKEKQDATVARMLPRIRASKKERTAKLGNLAQIDLSSAKPVLDQVKALPIPAKLKITKQELPQIMDAVTKKYYPGLRRRVSVPAASVPPATKLELRINDAHCSEQTRFERGADEIFLAGIAVDNLGKSAAFGPIKLGDFTKGLTHTFFDTLLFTFDTTQGTFPKAFAASLFAIESDFDDFVGVINAAGDVMTAMVAVVLLGAATGDFTITLIGLIAIGVALIVAGIAVFLARDELFSTQVFPIAIQSDSLALPEGARQEFPFVGNGGSYQMTFNYKPAA